MVKKFLSLMFKFHSERERERERDRDREREKREREREHYNNYRKAQLKGTSSLSKTSLRLPFGQYSVRIQIWGATTLAPTNLHKFA